MTAAPGPVRPPRSIPETPSDLLAESIIPGRWLVSLHPHATSDVKSSHMEMLAERTADSTPFNCEVHHQYNLPEARGYSAAFNDATRAEIEKVPEVASIEPVRLYSHCLTQTDAPWGLARLSQAAKLSAQGPYTYTYRDEAQGQGVTCYVLDTGINAEHVDFEGRASRGPKFVSEPGPDVKTVENDVQGHGTHCAGTIAGKTYGVAKKVQVIGIKVFNDLPRGTRGAGATNADIMAALQYVVNQYTASKKPSVVSMSLGGGPSDALDGMVTAAVRAGLPVCVAAGNAYPGLPPDDCKDYSPARVPLAITVGATDIADQFASFSFFGKMVDILAPGVQIKSCWCGTKDATNTISGTSMATPHVAGMACCLLSDSTWQDKSPSNVMSQILIMADKNNIGGIDQRKLRTINAVLQANNA